MNFYHLKYFYDVARLKSFTKAAQKNFITLPAVSQAIKSLELHLECALFVHKKNYFEITAQGLALYEKCENIFNHLNDIKNIKHEQFDELSGVIRLAAPSSIHLNYLAPKLSVLLKKHPSLELKIYSGNSRKISELFAQKEIDVAICPHDLMFQDLDKKTLHQGHFKLIHFPKAPLDQFIIGDFGAEVDHLKKMYKKYYKKTLPIKLEIQSWELIAEFTRTGLGVGLLPDFHQLFKDKKSKLLPQQFADYKYEICFYTKQQQSKKMETLFNEISEHK
jgi:DNA-binding transcriptional LysR family regulator